MKRRKDIIRTNVGKAFWRLYVSLGFIGLNLVWKIRNDISHNIIDVSNDVGPVQKLHISETTLWKFAMQIDRFMLESFKIW